MKTLSALRFLFVCTMVYVYFISVSVHAQSQCVYITALTDTLYVFAPTNDLLRLVSVAALPVQSKGGGRMQRRGRYALCTFLPTDRYTVGLRTPLACAPWCMVRVVAGPAESRYSDRNLRYTGRDPMLQAGGARSCWWAEVFVRGGKYINADQALPRADFAAGGWYLERRIVHTL